MPVSESFPFDTPILFLIYNRPELTRQVFAKIREIRPRKLFIAADGPRTNKSGDAEKCSMARSIATDVDWPCEKKVLFREHNLGCGKAVNEAIFWFFEHVEEGIIIEDDCLPSTSFFTFCNTLLQKYRNDDNIFVISGNNFQQKKEGKASYYYSAYGPIWGWATWKRAWKYYDFTLNSFNDQQFKNDLIYYFSTKREISYWWNIYIKMRTNPIDTWDYQWVFTQWKMHAINIMPNINLVSNIGCNEEGTHIFNDISGISNKKSETLERIIHPTKKLRRFKADLYLFDNIYQINKRSSINMFAIRLKNKIQKYLND